ncbi:MAG: hypothetical protein Q9174_006452 [Haloplaca sp. 1 TL-2023]
MARRDQQMALLPMSNYGTLLQLAQKHQMHVSWRSQYLLQASGLQRDKGCVLNLDNLTKRKALLFCKHNFARLGMTMPLAIKDLAAERALRVAKAPSLQHNQDYSVHPPQDSSCHRFALSCHNGEEFRHNLLATAEANTAEGYSCGRNARRADEVYREQMPEDEEERNVEEWIQQEELEQSIRDLENGDLVDDELFLLSSKDSSPPRTILALERILPNL